MLDELRLQGHLEPWAHHQGDGRLQLEQLPHRIACFVTLAELPVGCGEHHVRRVEARQVDLEREAQCAVVVALAVGIEEERKPIPSGMIGVELGGLLHQGTSPLPFARVRHEAAQVSDVASVHRVQREGPLGGSPEGLDFPAVEQGDGQGLIAPVTG